MTDLEAHDAWVSGQVTEAEYCSRDTWLTSGATQYCHLLNNPKDVSSGHDVVPAPEFSYDQAYAAWQGGMAYYDAFCVHYTPVTPGGVSQCEGIMNGTVEYQTVEYLGDQVPSIPQGRGFGCFKDENGNDYCVDPGPESLP